MTEAEITSSTEERPQPTREKSPDDMLFIKDIAREYRMGQAFVTSLVRTKQLAHVRVGRRALIPRWCMQEWVRENALANLERE